MKISDKIESFKKKTSGYWAERAIAQLEFAARIAMEKQNIFADVIEKTSKWLEKRIIEQNIISKQDTLKLEDLLSPFAKLAKEYKVIMAGHAHIDMNWLWGTPETVSVTIDTFRTMLNLMNEYPDFKFSQSQASTYQIIEEYAPDILAEIKHRVKEGRWEVTASTWVENDKNMSGSESLARHALYTRRYLSKLFDMDINRFNLDFEPDTFGHTRNLPELMAHAGIKYYYHSRGYNDHLIYNWRAESGESVLVYREPIWYNSIEIKPEIFMNIPSFCKIYDLDTVLRIQGVGDHGGGPSRRDIERVLDMSKWSIFPTIRFGTFNEYFQILEAKKESFPIVDQELNPVFTGCYTSQSRLKMANRIGEARLFESEALSAFSSIHAYTGYPNRRFEDSWRKILFNQFHDILPGSGIIDTREYAMGEFQKALATANSIASSSMRSIALMIDTSFMPNEKDVMSTSEGGGVGYEVNSYQRINNAERGSGLNRVIHLFNSTPYEWNAPAEITIWDYEGDSTRICVSLPNGEPIAHQILTSKETNPQDSRYWGHTYSKILINAKIPAFGYSTYLVSQGSSQFTDINKTDMRVETLSDLVLENESIKVVFDSQTMNIISIIDKQTSKEMTDKSRPSGFRFINEDTNRRITAWIVGRTIKDEDICAANSVKISDTSFKNALRSWISFVVEFGNHSKLNVKISLDNNATTLEYDVTCNWEEVGRSGQSIPQLAYRVNLPYQVQKYRYDVAFGMIDRDPVDQDQPGNSFICGLSNDDKSMLLVTDTKYGYRGTNNSLLVNLIRSSYDPDPYPENYVHHFRFGISLVNSDDKLQMMTTTNLFNHLPSYISGVRQKGILPQKLSFASIEKGSIAISGIKISEEDTNKLIVRIYEVNGEETQAVLKLFGNIKNAYQVDNDEKIMKKIVHKGNLVKYKIGANKIASISIEFE